jgi:hypothetical protein
MPLGPEWKVVKKAGDMPACPCCGEKYCEECKKHFFECDCPGPSQGDEYDYTTRDGVLYARKKQL